MTKKRKKRMRISSKYWKLCDRALFRPLRPLQRLPRGSRARGSSDPDTPPASAMSSAAAPMPSSSPLASAKRPPPGPHSPAEPRDSDSAARCAKRGVPTRHAGNRPDSRPAPSPAPSAEFPREPRSPATPAETPRRAGRVPAVTVKRTKRAFRESGRSVSTTESRQNRGETTTCQRGRFIEEVGEGEFGDRGDDSRGEGDLDDISAGMSPCHNRDGR